MAGATLALDVGETSLNHLRIQPSARSQGMGGVSLGLADNPQAFFGNPAGLSDSETYLLAANYLPYPAGIHIGSFLFKPAHKTPAPFRFSAGALYLNSGKMTLTSPTNEELGTFSYHVINLGGNVTFALAEYLDVGTNLRIHLASADSNLQVAAAADIGIMLTDIVPGLAVGLAARNVALEIMPFVEKPGAIPLEIGGGISYGVKNLLLALDVSKPLDAPLVVEGGIEFLPVNILALRGGYSSRGSAWKTDSGADVLAGFSFGLGIHDLVGVSVDYAITPGLDLGIFHRISVSYTF